jgi:hypothetical protein
MALANDKRLSEEFKTRFKFNSDPKRCFGFLCLDHQHAKYFNEEEDIDIAYIYADMISLYLMTRLSYTTYSDTFVEAQRLTRIGLQELFMAE